MAGGRTGNPIFRDWALKVILKTDGHPLKFLVDQEAGKWLGWKNGQDFAAIQVGHLTSMFSGAAERLVIEDADYNQLASWTGESKGVVFEKTAVLIAGVPVEAETAKMYVRLGLLRPDVLYTAPVSNGWTREFGIFPLPPGVNPPPQIPDEGSGPPALPPGQGTPSDAPKTFGPGDLGPAASAGAAGAAGGAGAVGATGLMGGILIGLLGLAGSALADRPISNQSEGAPGPDGKGTAGQGADGGSDQKDANTSTPEGGSIRTPPPEAPAKPSAPLLFTPLDTSMTPWSPAALLLGDLGAGGGVADFTVADTIGIDAAMASFPDQPGGYSDMPDLGVAGDQQAQALAESVGLPATDVPYDGEAQQAAETFYEAQPLGPEIGGEHGADFTWTGGDGPVAPAGGDQ